jgi:hypothetical protein
MHNLFNIESILTHGALRFPEWEYVRSGLKKSLGTVISYNRSNPKAVQSSHFLVRLLQSITVSQSQNLERYYANVDSMAMNLSMALKMTSSIYQGHIFNGIFYSKEDHEILIANSGSFDIYDAHKKWMSLCPVKVLSHPRSDLNLNLLNGRDTNSETGLCVIVIDIPLLAIQYRAFRMNEQYITGDADSQKSVMQFIHMYVLPNMLLSHLDFALFNRISNLYADIPVGGFNNKHPFYLTDFSGKIDFVFDKVLTDLKKSSKGFVGTLRAIPAATKLEMEQVMLLPDIPPTRQVVWALALARIPVIKFLFMIATDGPSKMNRSEVNAILRSIMQYRNNNIMRQSLPPDIYYQVMDDLDLIVNLSKYR